MAFSMASGSAGDVPVILLAEAERLNRDVDVPEKTSCHICPVTCMFLRCLLLQPGFQLQRRLT